MKFAYLIYGILIFSLDVSASKSSKLTIDIKDIAGETQGHDAIQSSVHLKVENVEENDRLNLRQGPGVSYPIVRSLPYDASGLIEISRSDRWVRVGFAGYVGWVHTKYVARTEHEGVQVMLGDELQCSGSEPHWTFNTQGKVVRYAPYGEATSFVMDSDFKHAVNHTGLWLGTAIQESPEQKHIRFFIDRQACGDDMSDRSYPYSIRLIDNDNNMFSGCCMHERR